MEEAVDHMQYFQHSRQSRPPKPKREAVRSMADKDKVSVDSQKDGEGESEIKELRSRCSNYAALPASSSHPTVRNRPRYKDLRYDGKCNLKAFLHKFVRQQWNETEQHDQFCFFLEGPAIEYYTLMLETTPA
uniref:Uncharacterized protein n=1 Tax=Magallana gigas TaxID=29159 RepID=K1P6K3_MAGGI